MAHTDSHGTHGSHGAHGASHAGHETTDANVSGVERFLLIVAVLLAIAFGLMWLMYSQLRSWTASRDVPGSLAVVRQGDRLPPLPRLQTMPVQDLATFRRAEAEALDAWAWVDKDKGIAQIPVSRAIEIVAAQGLPGMTAEPAAVAASSATETSAASASTAGAPGPPPASASPRPH